MVCYGRLSGEDLGGIDLGALYYHGKTIRGFWLNRWLNNSQKENVEKAKHDVGMHSATLYKSSVREVFKIENFMDAYKLSRNDQSSGKVLLDLS
jgi:hypothetical protein